MKLYKSSAAQRAATRRWQDANPDRVKRYRTGEHKAEVQRLVSAQGGQCAICETSDPGMRGWHIDHCHASGRTRAALCGRCNIALGYMSDSPARLRAAAAYIERHAALTSLL